MTADTTLYLYFSFKLILRGNSETAFVWTLNSSQFNRVAVKIYNRTGGTGAKRKLEMLVYTAAWNNITHHKSIGVFANFTKIGMLVFNDS